MSKPSYDVRKRVNKNIMVHWCSWLTCHPVTVEIHGFESRMHRLFKGTYSKIETMMSSILFLSTKKG